MRRRTIATRHVPLCTTTATVVNAPRPGNDFHHDRESRRESLSARTPAHPHARTRGRIRARTREGVTTADTLDPPTVATSGPPDCSDFWSGWDCGDFWMEILGR